MLYAAELTLFAYATFLTFRVLKQGVALNLLGLAAWLTLIFLSALVYRAFGWLTELTFSNLLVQFAAPVILCQVFFFAAAPFIFRRFRPETSVRAAKLTERLKIPRWLDRTICAILSLLLFGCFGTLFLLFASAAGESPSLRTKIENESLILRLFLPPELEFVENNAQGGLSESDSELRKQRDYLDRLSAGMANARDAVAEKTGGRKIQRYTRALNTLLNLTPEENQRLLSHHTELLPLTEHPALREIVMSERIMSLIDEAAKGSPAALYRLGDEPAITLLVEDPLVKRLLLDLDLVEMEARVENWRKEGSIILAPSWSLSDLDETWQLNSRLKSSEDWRQAPHRATRLTWPLPVRVGLARTTLFLRRRLEDSHPGRRPGNRPGGRRERQPCAQGRRIPRLCHGFRKRGDRTRPS